MPEAHFDEFWHFYLEQPFGLWRDDWRCAMQATVSANSQGAELEVEDFMPFWADKTANDAEQIDQFLANMR